MSKSLRGLFTGAVVGIFAILALISAGIALDYAREFQFENAAKWDAQLAAANGSVESKIRSALVDKARKLGLPIDQDSIEIHVTPPATDDRETEHLLSAVGIPTRTTNTGHVDIALSYDIPYRYSGGTQKCISILR